MDYIKQYHDEIKSGAAVVGKKIKKIYRLVTERIESGVYEFNEKKAEKAIFFIENYCHHCEGSNALFKLELWQKATVSIIFGVLDPQTHRRQFQEVVLIIGRKNGKSIFAAAINAYMAYCDGEYGANLFCIAPKLDQANLVFNVFYQMVQADSELSEISKKRRSDVYISCYNTTVKPIAFSAKKSDGYNPHMVTCDEIASWGGDNGIKQYDVMKSAFGARPEGLLLSISTAGYENDSIYDELMKRCTAVLNESSEETRLLPLLYIIDDVKKWDDIEELKKANPNMGVSVEEKYFHEEIAIAHGSRAKKREFLVKYCNIKQNSVYAWLEAGLIFNSVPEQPMQIEDFANSYCVGGIDLSQTTDLTAACVIIEKRGKLYCFSKFFLPKNKIKDAQERDGLPYELYIQKGFLQPSGDNIVDYHDVFKWFADLVKKHGIRPLKIGYDRYSAQYLIKEMTNAGFTMDDVHQGENLTPVLQEFEGIIKDGNFIIADGNDIMKVHMLDTAVKENKETRRIRPVKISLTRHIDGFMSMIDAMTVRQKWSQEIGKYLKNLKRWS